MSTGEENPIDVPGYYDAYAKDYDEYANTPKWLAVNDSVRQAIALLPEGRPVKALDLGAGTGFTVQSILRHADVSEIVAVDISANMLDKLKAKNISPGLRLLHSSIEDFVAETDETFDLVTAIGSLEFVPDLPQSLQNIGRVLRSGGALAFSLSLRPEHGPFFRRLVSPTYKKDMMEYFWQDEQVERGLALGGLEIVSRERLPAYDVGSAGPVEYDLFTATK